MDTGQFIWDAVQQYQIHQLGKVVEATEETVAAELGSSKATIRQLEERINRLVLICRATFDLLRQTSGVTEQQLANRILEIDMSDGKADGKVAPRQKRCPKCGAGICAKFNRCLFCGYVDASGDVFNTA